MPAQPLGLNDLTKNGFTLPGGEQVWGCAICRWPSPGPVGYDTSLAPERSSRLAASVTRSCSCRPCPSLASAALFLPRQGLSAFDCSGPHEQLLDRFRCMEPCAPVVSPRLDGALLHEHRLRVERRRLLNRQD